MPNLAATAMPPGWLTKLADVVVFDMIPFHGIFHNILWAISLLLMLSGVGAGLVVVVCDLLEIFEDVDTVGWVHYALVGLAILQCAHGVGYAIHHLVHHAERLAVHPFVLRFIVLAINLTGSIPAIAAAAALINTGKPVQIEMAKDAVQGEIHIVVLICLGITILSAAYGKAKKSTSVQVELLWDIVSLLVCGMFMVATIPVYRHFLSGVDPSELEAHNRPASHAIAILLFLLFLTFKGMQEEYNSGSNKISDDDDLTFRPTPDVWHALTLLVIYVGFGSWFSISQTTALLQVVENTTLSERVVALFILPAGWVIPEHLSVYQMAYHGDNTGSLLHICESAARMICFNLPAIHFIAWKQSSELNLDFEPYHILLLLLMVAFAGWAVTRPRIRPVIGIAMLVFAIGVATAAAIYPNPEAEKTETPDQNDFVTTTTTWVEAIDTTASEVGSYEFTKPASTATLTGRHAVNYHAEPAVTNASGTTHVVVTESSVTSSEHTE